MGGSVISGPAPVPPTLGSYVADHVMSAILGGEVPTNGRLVEADIARKLGVSRGPVREALSLLERDGLVVSIPRRGKFVVGVDQRILDEVYSLRRLLEPFAVGLMIDSLTEDSVALLSTSLAQLRAAVRGKGVREAAFADIEFHSQVFRLSGHSLLLQAWTDNIASKLQVLVPLTARFIAAEEGIHNHEEIMRAIVARDRREARRLLVTHVDEAQERAAAALSSVIGHPAAS